METDFGSGGSEMMTERLEEANDFDGAHICSVDAYKENSYTKMTRIC